MRAALAAAWLLTLAQAQQPTPFKSGVTLVTVDVTVVDADGRPVADLSPADFEIKLNNRVATVRGFSYLRIADMAMTGAVGPSFDAAPVAPAAKNASPVPRVFILLVDDLSFSPLAGKDLFAAARHFITSAPSSDLIGLTTSTGTVVVNPTVDRDALLAAFRKITGAFQDPRVVSSGPAEGKYQSPDEQVGLAQALDIDRGDADALKQAIAKECYGGDTSIFQRQSLEQLLGGDVCARTVQLSATRTAAQMKALVQRQAQVYENVIRAMRSASGIRHLLVLTDGVALAQDATTMQPVAHAAAEAGVQLSLLMATPDISLTDGGRRAPEQGKGQQPDTGAPQRRREDNQMLLNGARTTADMVGGTFYQITGDPTRFFDLITLTASGIYRIAVEGPSDTTPGKDFALAVRVPKRSGVTVRANRHAVAVAPGTTPTTPATAPAIAPSRALVAPADQMRRAIASGRALDGLHVTLDPTVRRGADPGQIAIDVAITVAASAQAPVSTMFGLVDASGAIRTSDKTLTAGDGGAYRIAFSVPVAPGAYKLRFAAADAGGSVGAIESAVDATLIKMGPLDASGLMLETLPGDGRRILAAIELYPAAGTAAPDVVVKMALVSASGDPAVERVVVPEDTGGRLRAEAEFALDRLPAGAYTLRASVLSGATVLGTVTRQVR